MATVLGPSDELKHVSTIVVLRLGYNLHPEQGSSGSFRDLLHLRTHFLAHTKFLKLVTLQTSYTLVYCEIAYILLLLENDQIFAKIAKTIVFGRTSSFFDLSKKKKRPLIF